MYVLYFVLSNIFHLKGVFVSIASNVQKSINIWLEGAKPIIKKLDGESEEEWEGIRSIYMSTLEKLFPAPVGVNFSSVDMGGIPTIVAIPDELDTDRTLFYIHGGGYVHGGVNGYKGLIGNYAKCLKAKVYAPDYRQAPEYPFPCPINDTFTAYLSLINKGIDPKKLMISGDSAGGAMLITIMRKAKIENIPLPVAGVAISPWADLTHSGNSAITRDGLDPICNIKLLRQLAKNFLGKTLPNHPDVSPIFADVKGLPPILIQVGENEVMLSDSIRLASHLGENQVRVSLEIWPEMFHVWHLFSEILPAAEEALENACFFLNNALSKHKI